MLSMSFLTQRVEGLEFIEFQRTDFYRRLSTHLVEFINGDGFLDKACEPGLKEIIETYTGFSNIELDFTGKDNFSVDIGYFSPNHILNNKYLDTLLKPNQTTLYRWFKENKDKVFKGSVDYKTGKVDGSFKTVPVQFLINPNLHETFPKDKVSKFGVPLEGICAGAFAHELGHVFGACSTLATSANDNILAKAALSFYKGVSKEQRVVVLKDIGSLLEISNTKQAELELIANSESEDTLILYFNKLLAQRNQSRALSVGVSTMTSEVVADMYAIRMGCDKGVIAAISILSSHGCIRTVLDSMLLAGFFSIFVAGPGTIALMVTIGGLTPAVAVICGTFGLLFLMDYFGKGYSDRYNSNHRRLDDALRNLIAKFKEDEGLSATERKELSDEIDRIRSLSKEAAPWYDNTVLHRFVGWVFNGSDFKRQEIEHYSQALANHEINIFSNQLNTAQA